MDNSTPTQTRWYDKIWLVIVLLVVFFPVGLYALWKSSSIKNDWKIGITILIGIILIANLSNTKKSGNSQNTTITTTTKEDSIAKVKKDRIDKIRKDSIDKAVIIAKKKWDNSKAGKIQKRHPDWTEEECENIAKNKIWIGMSLDMLKYERGNPNTANPSNYGNGVNWQWCWDNYTPSCFYGGEDGIITSYN